MLADVLYSGDFASPDVMATVTVKAHARLMAQFRGCTTTQKPDQERP